MKTKTKLLLARGILLCSALVAGLVLYLLPFTTAQVTTPSGGLTPTRPISEHHSTGGTSIPETTDGRSEHHSAPKRKSNTQVNSSSNTSDPSTEPVDNAPRQTEIRNKVKQEQRYQAFLLPNDPYAQSAEIFTDTLAPAAWDITTGGTVIVADIDSGYALEHEDLVDAWHTNAGEQGTTSSGDACWSGTSVAKASNGCDDDQNGYVDDWRGWNFVEVDNDPQAGRQDPNGSGVSHGTETAGLIGATTNNGIGIASLNWQTRVMPLQALADDGSGYTSDVIAAMYYAVDNGATIINMSLGSYQRDPYLEEAIQYAYDNNVVIVAAAGNCGTGQEHGCDPSHPGAMAYPAKNNHVIAVGAVNDTSQRASFSSYGPALDVVAPGSGTITSTMWLPSNETSAYSANLYGTSFATPIVTSLVSLLRSERPNGTVDDIIALVNGSARKVSGLSGRTYNTTYGHGLIDAHAAVTVAQSLEQSSAVPVLNQTGSSFSEHSYTPSSVLNSGCSIDPAVYCTVWAQNVDGHDRYLPYQLTSANGSWQWYGSDLGSGEWRLRARSGDNVSAQTYFMFAK